jgi:hypothetical protein
MTANYEFRSKWKETFPEFNQRNWAKLRNISDTKEGLPTDIKLGTAQVYILL